MQHMYYRHMYVCYIYIYIYAVNVKNFPLTISECPLRCLPEDIGRISNLWSSAWLYPFWIWTWAKCNLQNASGSSYFCGVFPELFWTTPISLTPNSPLVAPLWAHSSAEGSWVHGFKRRVVLWKTPFLLGQQQGMLLSGLMMFHGDWWWAYFFNGDSCASLTLSTCVCVFRWEETEEDATFMPHPSVILVKLKCPCHLCNNHIQSLHKL